MKKIKYLNGLFLLIYALLINACVIYAASGLKSKSLSASTQYALNNGMQYITIVHHGQSYQLSGYDPEGASRHGDNARRVYVSADDKIWIYGIKEDGSSTQLLFDNSGYTSSTVTYNFKSSDYSTYKYFRIDHTPGYQYQPQINFSCYAGSASGALDSITLYYYDKPSISVNIPTAKTYSYGDSLSFAVAAVGKEPLSYQWYKNDVAIPNATNSALNLGQQEDLSYHNAKIKCVITNDLGTATSKTCVLTANVGTFRPSISASSLTSLNHKKLPTKRICRELKLNL